MSNLAVVTGGTGGMGLAVARALGRDGPVLICDLDQQRLDTARAELEGGLTVQLVEARGTRGRRSELQHQSVRCQRSTVRTSPHRARVQHR